MAIITGALLFWLVDRLSGVLLPFLVAWLIAYLLEPFVQFNRRIFKLKGRFVAIALTLAEATVLMVALGIVFVPWIIGEVHDMAQIVKSYAAANVQVPHVPAEVHDFLRRTIDFDNLAEQMTRQDVESILKGVGGLVAGGVDLVLSLFGWLIVVLYVVFIMIDYERLIRGARALVPPRMRRVVFAVGSDVKFNMNHYFRGQALVSLCVGILFAIGFVIIGLPMGVVLGLFIGVLNMVPYLQLVSIVPTTVLCLVVAATGKVDFWTIWLEAMAVYCICQAIQDLFLTPKIMGKYMGLNPAIILLSLSVWGSLLGFIGLIIALPLTTMLLAYYKNLVIKRDGRSAADAVIDAAEVGEP